jgi:hypothetical protein
MNANIDVLLSRLDGVRRSGRGHVARCPAHADRTASLSLAEGDDGRVLVHCFAGCDVTTVLGAAGLDLSCLYPERGRDQSPMGRAQRREAAHAANVEAAIAVCGFEANVVLIAARDVASGAALDDADRDQLAQAVACIDGARYALNGREIADRDYRRVVAALHRGAEQAAAKGVRYG